MAKQKETNTVTGEFKIDDLLKCVSAHPYPDAAASLNDAIFGAKAICRSNFDNPDADLVLKVARMFLDEMRARGLYEIEQERKDNLARCEAAE